MPQISLKDGHTFEAAPGRRLVLAIEDAGIDILHRCGGHARCTTCRVIFIQGEPDKMTAAELERLEARGLLGEMRLSCQIQCEQDMKLEVVQRLEDSDLDDAGSRPADHITPAPTWVARPQIAPPTQE